MTEKKNKFVTRGKVARTISDYDIVVTVGTGGGVEVGDIAFVVRSFGVEDPDTGESLGDAQLTLARLRVHDVQERFCIAATFESVATTDEQAGWLPLAVTQPKRVRQRVTTSGHGDGQRLVAISVGDVVIINRPTPEPEPF